MISSEVYESNIWDTVLLPSIREMTGDRDTEYVSPRQFYEIDSEVDHNQTHSLEFRNDKGDALFVMIFLEDHRIISCTFTSYNDGDVEIKNGCYKEEGNDKWNAFFVSLVSRLNERMRKI